MIAQKAQMVWDEDLLPHSHSPMLGSHSLDSGGAGQKFWFVTSD